MDKSFEPSSAHSPADNGTEVPGGKVKLENLTFHDLSRFNSFYKPGCLSGHLMPDFPLIFSNTSLAAIPTEPPAGIPSSPDGSAWLNH